MQITDKVITKIEANPLLVNKVNDESKRLRVAAYCRVSTDEEDQLQSYKAQVEYYTDYISKNPKWKFVRIYADEGITGTKASKRENFLKMIRDCEKGRIDYILTKSVARFARNTVDTLKYVRKLKARGIGVFFEEQNLDTIKSENEMALGLYSVMAQAESENISANVAWGIHQRMRTGTYAFRYTFGYKKNTETGKPEIDFAEAEIVKSIFENYLSGSSLDDIKAMLERNGVRTSKGKAEWSKAIIKAMLTNEKYCGDVLLQKTYIVDPISKKVKVNRGERAKYLITNNHPAIIERDMFKLVQMEIAKRNSKGRTSDKAITEQGKYSGKYALTDILICGECGSPYRRKAWKTKDGTRYVWRCLNRLEKGKISDCKGKALDETMLQDAICRGLRKLIQDDDIVSDTMDSALLCSVRDDDSLDTYAFEQQIKENERKIDEMILLSQETTGDKTKYETEIKKLSDSIVVLRDLVEQRRNTLSVDAIARKQVEIVREFIKANESFDEYNDKIVRGVIRNIRVMSDRTIILTSKAGVMVEERVERYSRTANND